MAKEFHINFSCGTIEEGAKTAINQIHRMMQEVGAELVSKEPDDDGYVDAIFHHHSTPEAVTKLCNEVLDKFKHSHITVSTSAYEHKPGVLVDTKDTKDVEEFKKFVERLAAEKGFVSIDADEKDSSLLRINFARSSQRQAFQSDFTEKAGEYMKNGNSSVQVFPTWEDINLLQKNNYSDNKRTVKF